MPGFTVDTHLFRELGELLVGRDSTALIELIKNAYDADATKVSVYGQHLDSPEHGSIVVADDGVGMTEEQFTESPQMRVGSGGASSMPPQQRNSIEINAPGEWKP